MGALHEGHLSLIRAARLECDCVIVSIFVNPIQFCPGEDYTRYPKPIDEDLRRCDSEKVDLVFHPTAGEMYGDDRHTTVSVAGLTDTLCGRVRPGHFDGVTTVVTKLFNIVQPDVAYFGQKDGQQCAVIRQMVADLDIPVRIAVCPTVREADGLALSSRNAYLSPSDRQQARSLYEALQLGERMIREGNRSAAHVTDAMRRHLTTAGNCRIDYVEAVHPQTLQPLEKIADRCLLALAVRIGTTRLIDNRLVDVAPPDG